MGLTSTGRTGASPGSTVPGSTVPGSTVPGSTVPGSTVPGSVAEALAAVRAGLDYLAAANQTDLAATEQADCLRELAAAESVHLAVTARVLAAFNTGGGFTADGQSGTKSWLCWQTRVTRAAAGAATGWMRRLAAHPAIADALAAGRLSPSWARHLCNWSDQLPEDARADADDVLTGAALDGMELADIAALAEQIRARTAQPDADTGADRFGHRRLYLATHFLGHARLDGDLTPQATAALQAVLDTLGKRVGPEDLRSKDQRDHDALEEACRLLIASGCLPKRAGQPVQIQLSMTLSQLLGLPEADPATAAEIIANGTPVPPGADCDAAITPIVTGTIDYDLLDKLAGRYPGVRSQDADGMAGRAARQLTVAEAVRLLSGPTGLAARLRTGRLTGPAAKVSLPLDIGRTSNLVPSHIRRAVCRRDRRCRFPGCHRRPVDCHVHHLTSRADGGETSVENCCLLCPFHHLIAVHQWGWRLTLNPDGTTTAVSPNGAKTLHSHAPPGQAA